MRVYERDERNRHGPMAHFILITRPGKSPVAKGPFDFKEVVPFLQSARALHPDAVLTVCQVTNCGQLWPTSEKEWLYEMRERVTPNAKSDFVPAWRQMKEAE